MNYIAIKNWEKYQADDKGKVREGASPWIKDWTDKEADYEYSKLTGLQRYVYDALRRLRGRLGKNPPNDPAYIGRATDMLPRDRAHLAHAIRTLHLLGLITFVESTTSPHRVEKSREEKSRVTNSQETDGEDQSPTPSIPSWLEGTDDEDSELSSARAFVIEEQDIPEDLGPRARAALTVQPKPKPTTPAADLRSLPKEDHASHNMRKLGGVGATRCAVCDALRGTVNARKPCAGVR